MTARQADRDAITRERHLLTAIFGRDTTEMSRLMADGGYGVDAAMGCVSQRELISGIGRLSTDAGFEMDHERIVAATPHASVIAYRLRQWGRLGQTELPPVVWCTSAWSRASGTWQAVFHQETPESGAGRAGGS
jgi:hypothetical protein